GKDYCKQGRNGTCQATGQRKTSHLEMIIQDLGKSIEEYKAKLVMVDSKIALHRAEFTGRGTLAERQQWLNLMLHKLSRLAEVHNIAVVVLYGPKSAR
ncbi:MAG: hypothetical protein WBZ36_09815, partial [Candidatus Nitrosopolaris sp.]